ncbi:unnamed protein product [Pseudo-nitzschia multistriata]|uniref:Uncharacterized protein n=1 Tax=Pseudo-nitzschia multistriata TaxID=183589 RepID=A0A448ZRY7_9STRA|nr:unnamed protein product [Pseudo-nitzschia multistriata]
MKPKNDNFIKKKIVSVLVLHYVLTCWSLSLSYQTKLLVRQIRSQPNNVTHTLNVIAQIDTKNDAEHVQKPIGPVNFDKGFSNVIVAALRVCGNANKHELALELYKKYPSESARAMMISVLGGSGQLAKAVDLLEDNFCPPTAASFNAAIAACGKAKNWELALDIYQNKLPKQHSSTLSTNALLTVLAKCRKGVQALEILHEMVPSPTNSSAGCDSVTYSLIISALVRSNMLDEATKILESLEHPTHNCSAKSIEAMNDMVLSAYSQRSDWSGMERLERIRQKNNGLVHNQKLENSKLVTPIIQSDYRFHKWEGIRKVGKGKESYWMIGTYLDRIDGMNVTIGLRPHRNPSRNGIQLLFFENAFEDETQSWTQQKIGFLLMKNNANDRTSSLLGMFLKPTKRGRGISKVCLSLWIWLCLKASIVPVTGIIQKPLLALILQHTFGYTGPTESDAHGGVLVELSKDSEDPDCVVLSPLNGKSLEGAFGPWDMKRQNIKITSQQLSVRGRVVRIGCKLYPPSDLMNLKVVCDEFLTADCWECDLTSKIIDNVLLGKTM